MDILSIDGIEIVERSMKKQRVTTMYSFNPDYVAKANELVQCRQKINSIEAPPQIEKGSKERWEYLCEDLYSEIPVEQRKEEGAFMKILELLREVQLLKERSGILESWRKIPKDENNETMDLNKEIHCSDSEIEELIALVHQIKSNSCHALKEVQGDKMEFSDEDLCKARLVKHLLNEDDKAFKETVNGQLQHIQELHDAHSGLLLLPEYVNNKANELVQHKRKIKSLDSAQNGSNERWEDLCKDLYSEIPIEQSEEEEAQMKIFELLKHLLNEHSEILESWRKIPKDENNEIKDLNKEIRYNGNDKSCHTLKEVQKLLSCMSNVKFGVKIMGELDLDIFENSFKLFKYPFEVSRLYDYWDGQLKNLNWHPFVTIINLEGDIQEILNKDDDVLCKLKKEMGDQIYNAVTSALEDRYKYNPSRQCPVPVLWDFEKDERATLYEVISYIFNELVTPGYGRS